MQRTDGSWPVILVMLFTTSLARAQELTPALFVSGEFSLRNTLTVPLERPPGGYDVSLTCQTIVEIDGTATNPHCLGDERYHDFKWEVIRTISSTRMVPATVDGEPVRVLMNFMAGFRCLQACGTLLLPNHGRFVQDYGFDYSSPQPILEDDTWYEGYQEKLAWAASGMSAEEVNGIRYLIATRISTDGRSERRRVMQRSSGYWPAATRAASTLDDVGYIPGFHEGRPVELTLYEYWLDPNARLPETIEIPVRVHLLSSIFVEEIDSTFTDSEVQRFLDDVNAHWHPAAIQWSIESIVRVEAQRELGFRRATKPDSEIETYELYQILSSLCRTDRFLEGGWNICFVREFPWVATYLEDGLIIIGELDFREERVSPFALARELGESLGAPDTPTCTARFLGGIEGPDETLKGTCVTTYLSDAQIRASRAWAEKGVPFIPHRVPLWPGGAAGGGTPAPMNNRGH